MKIDRKFGVAILGLLLIGIGYVSLSGGKSSDSGHDMGSMKGMLTEDDLASLKKATGKEFDRLFLAGMIAHHDGAVEMLSMIEKTTNPDIKRLGNEILTSQSAEIEMMSQMLKAIG